MSKLSKIKIKQLADDALLVMFTFGMPAMAIKFATYLNQWVFFPWFPNLLDSEFIIIGTMYFVWRIWRKEKNDSNSDFHT